MSAIRKITKYVVNGKEFETEKEAEEYLLQGEIEYVAIDEAGNKSSILFDAIFVIIPTKKAIAQFHMEIDLEGLIDYPEVEEVGIYYMNDDGDAKKITKEQFHYMQNDLAVSLDETALSVLKKIKFDDLF